MRARRRGGEEWGRKRDRSNLGEDGVGNDEVFEGNVVQERHCGGSVHNQHIFFGQHFWSEPLQNFSLLEGRRRGGRGEEEGHLPVVASRGGSEDEDRPLGLVH